MKQCPHCHAPEGKPHATNCPHGNGNSATETVGVLTRELYPDSPHKSSFEEGLQFQDWVVERMAEVGFYIQMYTSRYYQQSKGESVQCTEIKLDNPCTDTGRLSIEVAEKTRADRRHWTPSGIRRDDNTIFYIQGNWNRIYLFAKKDLVRYLEEVEPEVIEFPYDRPTIQRFFLDFPIADRLCLMCLEYSNGSHVN